MIQQWKRSYLFRVLGAAAISVGLAVVLIVAAGLFFVMVGLAERNADGWQHLVGR